MIKDREHWKYSQLQVVYFFAHFMHPKKWMKKDVSNVMTLNLLASTH